MLTLITLTESVQTSSEKDYGSVWRIGQEVANAVSPVVCQCLMSILYGANFGSTAFSVETRFRSEFCAHRIDFALSQRDSLTTTDSLVIENFTPSLRLEPDSPK
jgi:hypothetical protein